MRGELNTGLLCCVLGEQTNCGFIWSCAYPSGGYGSKGFNGVAPARDDEVSWMDLDIKQPLMFSDNVQIMKGAEEMVAVSSSVRVQRFDDSSFLGGEGLYEFVPFVSLPGEEDCSAGGDWEVGIINERLAVAVGQGTRQNVKAASDGIDVDASLDLEGERERLFLRDYYHIVRNIRWLLSDSNVHIFVEPSVKPLLKQWEVGFGPIDRSLGVL